MLGSYTRAPQPRIDTAFPYAPDAARFQMSIRGGVLLMLASVGLIPLKAQAAIIRGTFSGTVIDGFDKIDEFGLGYNVDLTGQSIAGTFSFDSAALPKPILYTYSGYASDQVSPSVPITFHYTINGVTETVLGDNETVVSFKEKTPPVPVYSSVTGINLFAISNTTETNSSINETFSVYYFTYVSPTKIISNIHDLGTLSFDQIAGSNPYEGGYTEVSNAPLNFTVTSITAGPVSAVPIPSALPMFGAALVGLVGLTANYRRRPTG